MGARRPPPAPSPVPQWQNKETTPQQPPRARGSPRSLLPPGWEVTCWLAAFSLPLEGKGQGAPFAGGEKHKLSPSLQKGTWRPPAQSCQEGWPQSSCGWARFTDGETGTERACYSGSPSKPTQSWGLTLPSPDRPGHGVGVREGGLGGLCGARNPNGNPHPTFQPRSRSFSLPCGKPCQAC